MDINERIAFALRTVPGLSRPDGSINFLQAEESLKKFTTVSRQSVKAWCTNAKNIQPKNIDAIAKLTGFRELWLTTGKLPQKQSEAEAVPDRFNAETVRHAEQYQGLPKRRKEIIDAIMDDWFSESFSQPKKKKKPRSYHEQRQSDPAAS